MTVDDVIQSIPAKLQRELPPPTYQSPERESPEIGTRLGLAVKSMQTNSTDEGWQLFQALESAGYRLYGHAIPTGNRLEGLTCLPDILSADSVPPSTLVIQDVREWTGKTAGGHRTFDTRERFTKTVVLRDRSDIFKVTILKDAQNDADLQVSFAEEIGCHAWIVYYSPRIVQRLAPFVRERHLIRTWHSVDKTIVPPYIAEGRIKKALLSGAVSSAYPLRTNIRGWMDHTKLKEVIDLLPHPGYGRYKCYTPEYLQILSRYQVAICTCSKYGYALRKLIEATACGCMVLTNLPSDEKLPFIDDNLFRVPSDSTPEELYKILCEMIALYDPERQRHYAGLACEHYDYHVQGRQLASNIEQLRTNYV